ncbi:MAG: hypothetical protein U5Q44_06335 [Dehalococcoidia bacterium]|nr:hypothetical protein [Dehalococcoidia bacterium]
MSIGTVALLALLLAAACGGGAAPPTPTPDPRSPATTPTADNQPGTPEPAPDTLRVAYINLGSPITVDAEDTVAAETYRDRLDMVIGELQELQPDIVAVSEATWAPDLPNASWAILASSLGMEAQFARANPWFPGMSEEESDAVVDLVGFEEGEAILSRYPIRQGNRIELNPRASENEGRIAFHVIVRIPGIGDTNVYISRLAGPADARAEQALDLREVILESREDRPSIVLADMGLDAGERCRPDVHGRRVHGSANCRRKRHHPPDVLPGGRALQRAGGRRRWQRRDGAPTGAPTATPRPAEPQPAGASPTPVPEAQHR